MPPLFYVEETKYGCMQPVRSGDLVKIRHLGYGWQEEGKIAVVIGDVESHERLNLFEGLEECVIMLDGKKQIMRIEYLEAM